MPIILTENSSRLETQEVQNIASSGGLQLKHSEVEDFRVLLGNFEDCVSKILSAEDYLPYPDLKKYPRTDIHIPNTTDGEKGGWATRCTIKCQEPIGSLLTGKTLAIKDNIAVAGVRCTNGVSSPEGDWVPAYDATVVTRVLDQGAIIMGKSTCENCCLEPGSDTSCIGEVQNPFADGYSCGGSSSGSGRLVSIGAVDMALGGDQGGSVRIPASLCGIVGLKPTWGLVPYSGILGLYPAIDHCGPMTRTVPDNALLLEALAGPDGMDSRQPAFLPPSCSNFSTTLDAFLATSPLDRPLDGFKIGVLKEGRDLAWMDPNVSSAVSSAVSGLRQLGATVVEVSVPIHTEASATFVASIPFAGVRHGLLDDTAGCKQLYTSDRAAGPSPRLSQTAFDGLGAGAKDAYMRFLYASTNHGAKIHAKCANLFLKYARAYDEALAGVDVLVMPTVPRPALRNVPQDSNMGVLERLSIWNGMLHNTAPFDTTGHPALSLPVGFVPAPEDPSVALPTAVQIVSKRFADVTCFKVAAAWERKFDWKAMRFGF
ncbi:hypothetical protein FE257_005290 [Aspergillus nanangensis]|uniref:Amidase domain-containing protein n=1 Tax=Aspergillus nanangensis TaxID=2582783 RepID=A0AAD4CQV5_ASPNN|nr:hypothetical protein FE257_005290 [Aspergillus nanangensis]